LTSRLAEVGMAGSGGARHGLIVNAKDVVLAIFAASPALGALVLVFLALAANVIQVLWMTPDVLRPGSPA
jgi:hypothetical protein